MSAAAPQQRFDQFWAIVTDLRTLAQDPRASVQERALAAATLEAIHNLHEVREAAVVEQAMAAADPTVASDIRQIAWRTLSEERRRLRAAGCPIGQWASPLVIKRNSA